MQIEWSDDDVEAAWRRASGAPIRSRDSTWAIMNYAVELYLARASGQTKEDETAVRSTLETADGDMGHDANTHAALSRLSALAQEAEALRASADELQRQRDSRGEALEVAEQEIKTLRAKVATLEPHVERAEHYKASTAKWMESAMGLRAEVEGLKSEMEASWSAARKVAPVDKLGVRLCDVVASLVSNAQSLSSIRERAAQAIAECRGEGAREILRERLGWVLEGDAANSSTQSNGSGKVGHASTPGQCSNPDPTIGPTCAERGCEGRECRYPCSPTCTHDDAATPGHPERVKERSKALNAIPTATPDPYDWGRSDGIEAMRAACWEAVQTPLRILGGVEPGSAIWSAIKTAIESANP